MSPPHLWPSSLEQSPISLQQQQHSALPELKVRKMTTVTMDLPLWSKFSSMTKLARVLAYCLRFVHHKHRIRDPLLTHPPALSSEELKKAHLKIVQHLQRKAWPDEFQRLSSKQPVLLSSPTAKLNPYLDSSGVIRVGGRSLLTRSLPKSFCRLSHAYFILTCNSRMRNETRDSLNFCFRPFQFVIQRR